MSSKIASPEEIVRQSAIAGKVADMSGADLKASQASLNSDIAKLQSEIGFIAGKLSNLRAKIAEIEVAQDLNPAMSGRSNPEIERLRKQKEALLNDRATVQEELENKQDLLAFVSQELNSRTSTLFSQARQNAYQHFASAEGSTEADIEQMVEAAARYFLRVCGQRTSPDTVGNPEGALRSIEFSRKVAERYTELFQAKVTECQKALVSKDKKWV